MISNPVFLVSLSLLSFSYLGISWKSFQLQTSVLVVVTTEVLPHGIIVWVKAKSRPSKTNAIHKNPNPLLLALKNNQNLK